MKARSAKYVCLALAAAILGSFAISAGAEVIKVMPDSMNGWVVATQQGNTTEKWTAEFKLVGPGAAPAGTGSFYFGTGTTYANPVQKVYLGTNAFTGVALSDIVTFKYSTYLVSRGYGLEGDPLGQPPMIEIYTDKGVPGNQRVFVFKPYGWYGGHNVALGTWQEWDLLTGDGVNTGRWEWFDTGSVDFAGNWNWLVNKYPGQKLITPPTADYPTGNITGTSLSIRVGAFTSFYNYFKPGDTSYTNNYPLWRESSWIKACVDKLTIGVRQSDGSVVETTYDFEAGDATPRAITNKSTKDAIINTAKNSNLFKVFGRVVCDPSNPGSDVNSDSDYLWLDDGSGPIKVHVQAHDYVTEGDYASAVGTVDNTTTPATVESSKANFEILYNAFF